MTLKYAKMKSFYAFEVVTAEENTPIEYHILQGVRIDNPTQVQIVNIRQDSKATKTIIR